MLELSKIQESEIKEILRDQYSELIGNPPTGGIKRVYNQLINKLEDIIYGSCDESVIHLFDNEETVATLFIENMGEDRLTLTTKYSEVEITF